MSYGFMSFVLTVLIINISPGPAMLYVMNQSLRHGVRTGLRAVAGVELGVFFYVLLTAFGLMVVFEEVPLLHRAVQVVGACYLAYLAYLCWPRRSHGDEKVTAARAPESVRYAFKRGVLINLSNPKIGIFFISLLPQFVSSDARPAWKYLLIYGLIFNVVGILVNMTVGITANALRSAVQWVPWLDYATPIIFSAIAIFALIRGLA